MQKSLADPPNPILLLASFVQFDAVLSQSVRVAKWGAVHKATRLTAAPPTKPYPRTKSTVATV